MIRKKKHWMIITTGISISMSLFLAGCGVDEKESVVDMQTEMEVDIIESSQEETEVSTTEVIPEKIEYLPVEESKITSPYINEDFFTNHFHVEQEGKIYFREYTEKNVCEGNVLGNYEEVEDAEKTVVVYDENNQLKRLFDDYGYGSIYITEGRFFSQCLQDSRHVYSCDLDGSNKVIWDAEEILGESDSGFLVCRTATGGLSVICKGVERNIVEENVSFLGCFGNEIYYSIQQKDRVTLYSTDEYGIQKKITEITVSEIKELGDYYDSKVQIGKICVSEDNLIFVAGSYEDENVYFGGVIVSCKKDGTQKKMEYSELDADLGGFVLDTMNSIKKYNPTTQQKEIYLTETEYESLL